MSNHTPGPWTACDNNGYSIWRITSHQYRAESASRTVAEVVGDSAETESNARLIAAAPEMYELIECLSQSYDYSKSSHDLASTLYDLRCMALRLMAKIKGG